MHAAMASARLGAPKSLKLLTIGDSGKQGGGAHLQYTAQLSDMLPCCGGCAVIPGVGKSCLLARYAKDDFVDTHITTIGIDFQVLYRSSRGKRGACVLQGSCKPLLLLVVLRTGEDGGDRR